MKHERIDKSELHNRLAAHKGKREHPQQLVLVHSAISHSLRQNHREAMAVIHSGGSWRVHLDRVHAHAGEPREIARESVLDFRCGSAAREADDLERLVCEIGAVVARHFDVYVAVGEARGKGKLGAERVENFRGGHSRGNRPVKINFGVGGSDQDAQGGLVVECGKQVCVGFCNRGRGQTQNDVLRAGDAREKREGL